MTTATTATLRCPLPPSAVDLPLDVLAARVRAAWAPLMVLSVDRSGPAELAVVVANTV